MDDSRAVLGSLMFGAAALCRSFGVTDPDDMDRMMIELMKNVPPELPSEAIVQVKAALAACSVYDQRMTTYRRPLPPSDGKGL